MYLLRANRILTEDLQVPVSVSTDGDFGAGSGVRRVGIWRGTNRTYHQFQTTDDDTDEANGSITAMALRSGVGYKIAAAGNQATVRVVDKDPGPAMTYTTIRIATAAAVITEGADAVFTITADPPPPFDLPVHLRISSQGGYGVSGRGMQLTILADETELTHTVRTTGDLVDEPNGSVTAQVRCYWGSECTPDFANDAAEVTVNDNDDGLPSSPPGLRLGRLEGEPRLAVRWDEVPEATGYEVHWGEAGEPARRTGWVNAPVFTTPEVAHAFRISACNDAGCSERSLEVQGSPELSY